VDVVDQHMVQVDPALTPGHYMAGQYIQFTVTS
jgi:hypothetical protein